MNFKNIEELLNQEKIKEYKKALDNNEVIGWDCVISCDAFHFLYYLNQILINGSIVKNNETDNLITFGSVEVKQTK